MPQEVFHHTGGWQTFNVPKGVEAVFVTVDGAGASSNPAGRVTGRLTVHDDQVLKLLVGEAGHQTSTHQGGETATGGGGRGGDGNGNQGGDGGGGGSFIRRNTTDGTLLCAAGGAGGDSGDNGQGGEGGAAVGEDGSPGTSGSNDVGNATGGTQSQGGNGGTSSAGAAYAGNNADNTAQSLGGRGGSGPGTGHGGGGGGGGFRSGGGGQASLAGFAPGGGGGGGSNYIGQLTGFTSERSGGGLSDGTITIEWVNPPPANQPPSAPTNVKVDGKNEANALATKSTGRVEIEAELNDPDQDRVQMLVQYTAQPSFSSSRQEKSELVKSGERVSVVLTGLSQDTQYYYRLWSIDVNDRMSLIYNGGNFWTNRQPNPPTLVAPSENATLDNLQSVTFDWTHHDPDPNDDQSGFTLRYRVAATATSDPGGFIITERTGVSASQWTFNPGTFKSSTFYEWQVRTRDQQNRWGDWSELRSFFMLGTTAPPIPISPIRNVGVDTSQAVTFKWKFVDPAPGQDQTKADFRYRLVGQSDAEWITVLGSTTTPGSSRSWTFGKNTFAFPGYHYEWQVRSYNSQILPSDWSESGVFWTIGTPGSVLDPVPVVAPDIKGSLGCGTYRVFLYAQGGKRMLGEIKPIKSLMFRRVRDDISNCILTTNGFDQDCGQLLADTRSWLHEMVVFRDGQREWEGPITRITYTQNNVELEAQDVMVYVYRRIMRQGFNDAYRVIDGEVFGLPSVVDRAAQIIVNALAPNDPNVLGYLTTFEFSDDARESRVVPDYSTTAWETVDDLAATAGLDYTVVGRRIILWDTHRPIGRLPEMRDGDFSDPPVVTEYGMQLCNYFAVTNNSGVWGAAVPKNQDEEFEFYGPIEMLASAYGESEGASGGAITKATRDRLEKNMREQARRNIADRWPTPVIVRVPDNSTLNPDANIGFSELIPGVWIPLRSTATLRTVEQWQKLDSVTVNVDASGGEKVSVVMSPAPNHGEDPDAAGVDTGAGA